MLYPLKLKPIYKEYIWGGKKLKERFGKDIPSNITAESWEVACHPNGMSIVDNGVLEGKTLKNLIDEYGIKLLGEKTENQSMEKFPLLIKLLDASDKLSVQVHPDDQYAFENENGELGKTEMWYIIDAEPEAQIVYGVKSGVSKQEFAQSIINGDIQDKLNYVSVRAGDVFFIPAKTLHALGKGILVAEIQQNSDTTYRVYDWDRIEADGKPRQLHTDKALDIIDFSDKVRKEKLKGKTIHEGANIRTKLVSCEYFSVEKLNIKDMSYEKLDGSSFNIIMIIKGYGSIKFNNQNTKQEELFKEGDTFLIPAFMGEYEIVGKCEIIKSYL